MHAISVLWTHFRVLHERQWYHQHHFAPTHNYPGLTADKNHAEQIALLHTQVQFRGSTLVFTVSSCLGARSHGNSTAVHDVFGKTFEYVDLFHCTTYGGRLGEIRSPFERFCFREGVTGCRSLPARGTGEPLVRGQTFSTSPANPPLPPVNEGRVYTLNHCLPFCDSLIIDYASPQCRNRA